MTEEAAFLSAMRASPRDDTLRLVFADWLEERNDLRGEYLRTEVALRQLKDESVPEGAGVWRARRVFVRRLAELQPLLSPAWMEVIHRMLPEAAFPAALPLGLEGGSQLLAQPEKYRQTGGAFLTFVAVPTASRFGDWHFAGVGRSLTGAADQVEQLIASLGGTATDGPTLLQYLLDPESGSEFSDRSSVDGLGPHRLVLDVYAGAPNDHTGVCIVEVPPSSGDTDHGSVEASVAGWRVAAIAEMLESGTRLWGPPPPEVFVALQQQSGPADWTRWAQSEWGENPNWSLSEAMTGPSGWDDVLQT